MPPPRAHENKAIEQLLGDCEVVQGRMNHTVVSYFSFGLPCTLEKNRPERVLCGPVLDAPWGICAHPRWVFSITNNVRQASSPDGHLSASLLVCKKN